jgi:hypothetical protein
MKVDKDYKHLAYFSFIINYRDVRLWGFLKVLEEEIGLMRKNYE